VVDLPRLDGVDATLLAPDQQFALKLETTRPLGDPVAWAQAHREMLRSALLRYGAVFLRGFGIDPKAFKPVALAMSDSRPSLEYIGGTAPRSKVDDGVYLSTELPSHLSLLVHQEMSYMRSWPANIFFYCDIPSKEGGATPIASARALKQELDPAIYDEFKRREVRYVRNYRTSQNMDWRKSFQTTDRAAADRLCRDRGLTPEWVNDDHLRVVNTAQGVGVHPITKEEVFINAALNFSMFSGKRDVLTPRMRSLLKYALPHE
jgi:hypothetical protein